jgi:hypothetical protein
MSSKTRPRLSAKEREAVLKNIIFVLKCENHQLRAELWRTQQHLPPVKPPGWITSKQAAHELGGISAPRIHQLMEDGRLWWVKIGHNVYIDPASPALKS